MKNIYAIRDTLADELVGNQMYLLFVFRTDQQAVRYFADALYDKTSKLNRHADDYELIKVGEINDQGRIEIIHDDVILTGKALVASQPQEA